MGQVKLSLDLLVCHTCGTQFDAAASNPLTNCKICDDPRQFVPASGQKWTSLRTELGQHKNTWEPLPLQANSNSTLTTPVPSSSSTIIDPSRNIYTIATQPKLGIGERCLLIKTPKGNILWDLIAYLDQDTADWITSQGGLAAIVISHPHYYTTHLDWAETFDCPVYIAAEDEEWTSRSELAGKINPDDDTDEKSIPRKPRRRLLSNIAQEIVPGLTAIKVGGHFPGSLVLHWKDTLFLADSLVTQPSALYHLARPDGTTSFTFMYSIPNMIPLSPAELFSMWRAMRPFDFDKTHGAFTGQDVYDPKVKGRILESMKIQARHSTGHDDHEICREQWP